MSASRPRAEILIRAPLGRDAQVLADLLDRHGYAPLVPSSLSGLLERIGQGCAQALILSEEALAPDTVRGLRQVLDGEPAWAALPLVVLIDGPDRVGPLLEDLRHARPGLPVTLITRPAPALTVLSAVETAVRAREAQQTIGRLLGRREAAEQRSRHLLMELEHRTRNLLGTIDALAHQTLKQTADLVNFQESFSGRLRALARTYDVLARGEFQSAVLGDLASRILEPFAHAQDRLEVAGPELVLPAGVAQTIGMCLHEFGTNAVKYGALSVPEGRVRVRWSLEPETRQLHLEWCEQNGPAVRPPSKEGFGTMFIRSSIEMQPGGKAEFDYAPEGFSCSLQAELPAIAGR